ncbi:MAG: DUF1343 domain-containing protein [Gemmatimonadaceae bacterium]|nr:DUF1343 domain-containing protein [Gemmatimonadaceae bacterium]
MMRYCAFLLALTPALGGCVVQNKQIDPTVELTEAKVKPGITVLLGDSIELIRNKRIALLTNQTGVNEKGVSDIDLLVGKKAKAAHVTLVRLFSPEHGIRGTEDREQIANGTDRGTGLPIISLYTNQTVPPPDSLLTDVDALVFDLQDIGTRTWTYVGELIYSMRAAARTHKQIIVLDRPNPITGYYVEGPILDSSLSNANDPSPGKPGTAYALYPMPLRHGMTMGELAQFYNETLNIHSNLKVVPVAGWRRDVWYDLTGLPWVKPSPNIATLHSAMLYPALVMFEATNMSVGRGTSLPFQLLGAPWLKVPQVVALLKDRQLTGVRFTAETFMPVNPSDGMFGGKLIPGIRITVIDRSSMQVARVGATLLWAINKVSPNELKLDQPGFDHLFGSPSDRAALLSGDDPDAVIDKDYKAVYEFRALAKQFLIYK